MGEYYMCLCKKIKEIDDDIFIYEVNVPLEYIWKLWKKIFFTCVNTEGLYLRKEYKNLFVNPPCIVKNMEFESEECYVEEANVEKDSILFFDIHPIYKEEFEPEYEGLREDFESYKDFTINFFESQYSLKSVEYNKNYLVAMKMERDELKNHLNSIIERVDKFEALISLENDKQKIWKFIKELMSSNKNKIVFSYVFPFWVQYTVEFWRNCILIEHYYWSWTEKTVEYMVNSMLDKTCVLQNIKQSVKGIKTFDNKIDLIDENDIKLFIIKVKEYHLSLIEKILSKAKFIVFIIPNFLKFEFEYRKNKKECIFRLLEDKGYECCREFKEIN